MPTMDQRYPSQKGKISNKANGQRFAHTIRKALKQYDTRDPKCADALRKIADGLIECALDKESPHYEFAIKEIGARVDGSPKRGEEGARVAAELLHGISAAFTALNDFKSRGQVVNGKTIMPDRPVLSSEVCVEKGGYGEEVGVREVSGDSSEP